MNQILVEEKYTDRKWGPLKFFVETYGCQMNFADSEIISSVMASSGYESTNVISDADVVMLNTCSIREAAEEKIYFRLDHLRGLKRRRPGMIVGLVGCMAERLRKDLFDGGIVDIIVGPDEYRKLPQLVDAAQGGTKGVGVQLSRVETYDDIIPLRTEGISAFLSVMRGCDKFCSFCVVPFTRGRERSRTLEGVVRETALLVSQGFRDLTLLGQNVNSYSDGEHDFADLLAAVAGVSTELRVRFTTSNPQDMSVKLIETIAEHDNICNYIHLPVQSGSDKILKLMNRQYTRSHYMDLVRRIKEIIPGVCLSTDIITGFPTETEDDHRETISLIKEVQYDGAYTFNYSPRENTKAWEFQDDVPEEVKSRRLAEVIDIQRKISFEFNSTLAGRVEKILVEGPSKKNNLEWQGRTDTNKTVIFPFIAQKKGSYIDVRITRFTSATLFGEEVL